MQQHLIALDLDGTLLNNQSELSKKTILTIQKLRDLGHIVVIATGRPFIGAIDFYQTLKLNTIMINDNGGLLTNPSDQTFEPERVLIPTDVLHRLFQETEPIISSALFTIENTVYAYKYSEKMELAFSGTYSNNRVEKRFDELDVNPTGIIYAVDEKDQKTLESIIYKNYADIFELRTWGVFKGVAFYEIYQKKISKASALDTVINYYQIPHEHVIAFGDGINDIEMLLHAHHGVAMLNGVGLIRQSTPFITTDTNDDDGVAKYLIKYFKLDL